MENKNRFDEKEFEEIWDADKKATVRMPVWQSPKYKESKKAAEKFIDEKKIVTDADFWILKNKTKSGKMAYTGLIMSHNGCLKINDAMGKPFKPNCLSRENNPYNNSLVFTYCDPETGIYEVGEVSQKNCSNEYPFAMALKRCFDRVILKLCKLAYAGIYSESEADEFEKTREDSNTTDEKKDETPKAKTPEAQKTTPPKSEAQSEIKVDLQTALNYSFKDGRPFSKYTDKELETLINNQNFNAPKIKAFAKAVLDSRATKQTAQEESPIEIETPPLTDDDLPF